ncbi:MAG: hypothetical protein OEW48_18625, partial [Phycisphaerae bacterium]|nr:hypothetical protein [Phycisphaerae bacterium]
MRTATAILLTMCCCVSGLLAGTEAEQPDELVGRWEQLSLPPSRHPGVSAIGIEPEGTLWVMANNSVYYWDGQEFRQPVNTKLTSGYYLAKLYGGPDRGLYATQTGEHDHTGKVYKLVDGNAIYVTDFYYDKSYNYPALYVSKSGLLFNWGTHFLAVYFEDQWKQIEAHLSPQYTLTFDTGDKVYFYYNGNLYSVDRDGNFNKRQISAPIESIPVQKRIHGVLWGQDKMLIFDYVSKQFYAYHLDTGEPVNTEPINSYLADRSVNDLFSTNNGDVWLLIRNRSYALLRITPECDITTVKETAKLSWDHVQFRQFPHSVLSASDGSIWFSSRQDGIVRYKNGKLQVFDWRQGVSFGICRYILEDSQGQIYVSSDNGVHVFRQGQPTQLSTQIHQWQEYRPSSSHPVRDSEGNIWMCLEDHPGHISRWDGYRWHHMKVPFDTSKVHSLITDDQGHILLSAPSSRSLPWYDISPYDINQYKNLKDILIAAVARGAKRFHADRFIQISIAIKGSKIWIGHHNTDIVSYFDGEQWDDFYVRTDIDYLYESPKYGILIRTKGGKYYTYDGGQISLVEIPKYAPTRWLLGPKYLQPFEQEILDEYPEEYIPVERAEDGKYYMLVRQESDNTNTSIDSG